MGTVDDVMRISAAEVGYSRYIDPLEGTKYGRWYAELTNSPYFGTTGVHYCAMFVSWVFAQADVTCKGFPTASCTGALLKPAWAGGYLIKPADLKKGDAVLFDWSGAGWQGSNADHVGIVRENMGSYLLTREGNVSGEVKDCTREMRYVVGGIRPAYDVEKRIFSDVTSKTPHASDIEWLKAEGITTGYGDGSYRPSKALTRGDCAAFLHRLGDEAFSDVDATTPHLADILWLYAMGISTGFADGTFRPYSAMTRADLAAFLYRMAGSPDFADSSTFTDVDGIAHERAVRWLGTVGIAKGYADGTFRPYRAVTRADAAAMLHRAATL